MLLDELLSYDARPGGLLHFVVNNRFKAKRFLFEQETANTIGRMLLDHPNVFMDNWQFAKAPYPVMYIEIPDYAEFTSHTAPHGTWETPDWVRHREKTAYGFFYIHGAVILIAFQKHTHEVMLSAPFYAVNSEGVETLSKQHNLVDATIQIPSFTHDPEKFNWNPFAVTGVVPGLLGNVLGTTMYNPRAVISNQNLKFIMGNIKYFVPSTFLDPGLGRETFHAVCSESICEIRNYLSLVLWLNQPHLYDISSVSASRKWVNGKMKSFMAHHTVKIKQNLGRKRILSALGGVPRSPRRHEVRGFWRNHNKRPGCIHDFPLHPDDEGRYRCRQCDQFRVWVRNHYRGDARVGIVTKEYKV